MARQFSLQDTRNIGIAAHIDDGKNTTSESILYYTGRVHSMWEEHASKHYAKPMYYKKHRTVGIRRKFDGRNQAFSFGGHKLSLIHI